MWSVGDEPARHPAALPGGCRLSPGCHSAGSPSGRGRALRSARRSSREPTAGIACGPLPLRTSSPSAAGSVRVGEPAIRGPMPPSPARPWHLAHDARPLLLARASRTARPAASRCAEPRVELGPRHDLHRGEHSRVLEPAQLGALAGVGTDLGRPRTTSGCRCRGSRRSCRRAPGSTTSG